MDTVKQTILKYWFYASALALAVLYFLNDRRGRRIDQLIEDAQRAKLGQALVDIQNKANQSQEDFEHAQSDYEAIRNRHADLLAKLGLSGVGIQSSTPTKH